MKHIFIFTTLLLIQCFQVKYLNASCEDVSILHWIDNSHLQSGRNLFEMEKKPMPQCHCGNEVKDRRNVYCSPKCWGLKKRRENNHNWEANPTKYATIHDHIKYVHGKALKCEKCGTKKAKLYEWASIGHTYTLDIKDWIQVCRSCHQKLDGKNKPIQKLDNNKNVVGEYEDAAAAILDLNINNRSSIYHAIRKEHRCGGFYWRHKK